ncbi:flagellar assembly protein FliW [Anaerovorax sp. IOR16]|uniref:flagellar assembly protein FliW n=1 Tax=Anaerovorax sp. IOR16 TaxID=2773458 RepID=UPI0019D0A142|nr:flagellar assembly protein FliW [Anaerovorax sp. IOR16]
MKVNTKYFGELEINTEEVLSFTEGLFGFESEKQFILIRFDDDTILCLQSLKESELAFIVMNPFHLFPNYTPMLSNSELQDLDATTSTDLFYYVIAVIHEPFQNTTINLKCPIAVNPEKKKAKQVILENSNYAMRETIVSVEEKEGLSCSY